MPRRTRFGNGAKWPEIRHGRACPGHPDQGAVPFLSEMPGTRPGMTRLWDCRAFTLRDATCGPLLGMRNQRCAAYAGTLFLTIICANSIASIMLWALAVP